MCNFLDVNFKIYPAASLQCLHQPCLSAVTAFAARQLKCLPQKGC